MNKQFWSGKRVLVTGHTGFKGSWLSLCLQQLGAEVIGFALKPPTHPNLFEMANLAVDMTSVIGDICNSKLLLQTMQATQPEIVIHMAAQALVRYSYTYPMDTYATNVMGTVCLLEAIRRVQSVRVVVNVTSDKCYENKERLEGYCETEPLGGNDPYSSSKACAELVTNAYRHSFFHPAQYKDHGVAIASARAGNVIGGGDWATDRLIPDIIRAIQSGKSVKIRNPQAIRPWQHVLEPLNGYLLLAEHLYTRGTAFGGAWNFGSSSEGAKTVQWIVEQLISLWGEGGRFELDPSPQVHEANYLKLDCSKAKAKMGWQERWSLTESLDKVVRWHKNQQQNIDMREFTLEQINAFMDSKI